MTTRPPRSLDIDLARSLCERFAEGRAIRRQFHPAGRVVMERPLPFVFVYRTPAAGVDPGAASLIQGEASYLVAPAGLEAAPAVEALVAGVAESGRARFGGFLVVEVWSGLPDPAATPDAPGSPGFQILTPPAFASRSTVAAFARSLRQVVLFGYKAQVSVTSADRISPPGFEPLFAASGTNGAGVCLLGLEVRPVYRDAGGIVYPMARRNLRRQLGPALRRTAFEFSRRETTMRSRSQDALARRAFTSVVWEADRRITEISRRFDLLLVVTPTRAGDALREFQRLKFAKPPNFLYRARTIDPPLLKRELYAIPVERVADPTLAFLFEEKRRELDLKLTMVEERLTRRFLPTGIALYGTVDPELVAEAEQLLERVPHTAHTGTDNEVDASEFLKRAESMLETLRSRAPDITSRVLLSDDVSSLTVTDGDLLIGSSMTFAENRVEALLNHELGTHVVTHWNGSAQSMSLLSAGLAGYDELQEGLAVFAEYLVGGLTAGRLRSLAGRVLAARSVVAGDSFVETFREQHERLGFSQRAAFTNTMRVHRGGGFVKDAVYLRGLRAILEFVREGGNLETMLIGKVATHHAPLIEELQRREILKPLALRPLYLDDPDALARLARARAGLALHQLIEPLPDVTGWIGTFLK
jgi:uncharacterized protein (TIGR02421 family)